MELLEAFIGFRAPNSMLLTSPGRPIPMLSTVMVSACKELGIEVYVCISSHLNPDSLSIKTIHH